MSGSGAGQGQRGSFFGSLKDALVAASRDDTGQPQPAVAAQAAPPRAALPPPGGAAADIAKSAAATKDVIMVAAEKPAIPSAADAAREARGTSQPLAERHGESDAPPTTRVVRAAVKQGEAPAARTQLVRGKMQVKRGAFEADPVVGWLVVVGGPGIGQYRPIFEGNNTIGRGVTNRIAVDFGDDAISTDEQAYIRYDSAERSFLFVPNLSKTNVVSVNEKRPTGAIELAQMDVITMGRTQLVFVPFCGPDFDWSAIVESNG